MDYVKVINPGNTYTTLAGTQSIEFWGAFITNNTLPISGRTYEVVKRLDHPNFDGTEILTIMDNNGRAFIVGIDGIEESTREDFEAYTPTYSAPLPPQPTPIQIRPMRRNITEPQQDNKYVVGDIILITSSDNQHYGKRLRVTDPNYRGCDVVTSRTDFGTDKAYGFKFSEFKRCIPEPEMLPEDKPKFSVNELLEVLRQNKPADGVLLDLMDHITN